MCWRLRPPCATTRPSAGSAMASSAASMIACPCRKDTCKVGASSVSGVMPTARKVRSRDTPRSWAARTRYRTMCGPIEAEEAMGA